MSCTFSLYQIEEDLADLRAVLDELSPSDRALSWLKTRKALVKVVFFDETSNLAVLEFLKYIDSSSLGSIRCGFYTSLQCQQILDPCLNGESKLLHNLQRLGVAQIANTASR